MYGTYSIVEQSIQGVGFGSIIEVGRRVYSIQSSDIVINNSIVSAPLSLYLHFITEEKRAKHKPHLLAEFSFVLGFPGYILCSFM
jgi:hypothetical protein